MKKNRCVKVVISVILAVLLFVATVPAMAAGFDMDAAIAEFEQTQFNAKTLKVGQTISHPAAVWTNTGRTVCYSSDEAVVTVDASGKVTAVGEGQAYVAVVVEGASYNLCRYDVTSSVNAENSVNDKLEDYMNRWEDDNSYENSYEEYSATRRQFEQRHQQRKTIILVIATLVIFLLVFFFGSIIHLSITSMKKKELPSVRHTSNTVTTPMAPRQYCLQCGQIYGSADFCPKCGSAKVVPNTYVVPINGRITAQKLETVVNEWLAENPYAYDCKLNLETKASLLIPFVQCKFFVKRAEIEFSVADKPQNRQYGLAFIYKFRLFGPIGYSTEKHIAQWQANNQDCQIVSTHGGRIQHFGTNSGFWAQYYNYVFFKKN